MDKQENLNALPAHVSKEMATIIMQVEDAIKKDNATIEEWKKRRKKSTEHVNWQEMSETEKLKLQRDGVAMTDSGSNALRRQTRAIRRKLRYKIFRLREGKWQTDPELAALKSWYEMQFQGDWTWADFTFKWDISAIEPLKVITPFEWDGEVISFSGGKQCDPSAFTNQHM